MDNEERCRTTLRWWRERCIESCHLDIKTGKCGDQMYLNDWPERFPGVHVLEHRGGGDAPWNVDRLTLRRENGQVLVEDAPLIFYHFHSLRILGSESFRLAYRFYIRADVADLIYRPYTRALTEAMIDIQRLEPSFQFAFSRPGFIERLWDFLFSFRPMSRFIAIVRQTIRQSAACAPATQP